MDDGKAAAPGQESAVHAPETPIRPLSYVWANPRRLAAVIALFLVVLVITTAAVVYLIGPVMHDRDQRALIASERAAIDDAARDNEGLYRPTLPTQPPVPGAVVGIIAIPAIGLEQAVVEGAGSAQTISGPGHVPGTAGLGQPGNSAVVGRRSGYGGPFANLKDLRPGDRIIVATTEGQSIYVVRSVRSEPTVSMQSLYAPTAYSQLTLVTSSRVAPWNTDQATVVVARMRGYPYVAVPQESRSPSEQGNSGDPGALAWLILDLLALAAIVLASAALYRRTSLRSAYLLTTAPLLVFTILAAESLSRLLPAWL